MRECRGVVLRELLKSNRLVAGDLLYGVCDLGCLALRRQLLCLGENRFRLISAWVCITVAVLCLMLTRYRAMFYLGYALSLLAALLLALSALPIQIFAYANSPYQDWHRQAWAGALVLVFIVLTCSLIARFATRKLEGFSR